MLHWNVDVQDIQEPLEVGVHAKRHQDRVDSGVGTYSAKTDDVFQESQPLIEEISRLIEARFATEASIP